MVGDFCTPLSDGLDAALQDKIMTSVRTLCVDGALMKVFERLRDGPMGNVILILRDPTHAIRIAIKEPLQRTGRFEDQWQRLFHGKHALLKDVMHSRLWQARLEDCQRLVLNSEVCPAGPVKHIMRHFSYAPQRFESESDPRRKYVCSLNAIALLLADVAGDRRCNSEERARALKSLDAMTPQDILEAGLAADYCEVGVMLSVKGHLYGWACRGWANSKHNIHP